MKGKNSTPCIVAITAGFALTFSACRDASSEPKPLLPVHVANVEMVRSDSAVRYSANIVPYAQVDLAFKSGGYVKNIPQVKGADGRSRNIDAGDRVAKGTVLAVVDQQDYKNKVQQANDQLARAQAEYNKAKLSFDRTAALYSSKSATKPDYDSAQANLESTTAAVSSAKAQISDAQIALDYCFLRAPFDAWIVNRSVDIGSLVSPATKGFSISDTRSVKAVFGVPDISMRLVKLGQRITIQTDALPQPFIGRVTSISPAADPKSRVYSIEVTIPNHRDLLKAGMIASLALGAELANPTPAVPMSSLIHDPARGSGFAIMIAEGSGDTATARLRPVELGAAYGNQIAITKGVTAGDRVITTGVTLIKNGDTVQVVP